jgi:Imm-5 like putative immunity protein
MNELMQQTLAGLPQHDRRLVREIRRLVDDARRIGAEMDVGEVKVMQARAAGGHAMGTARDLCGAARHAAYAAGQAGAVAHVAAHELGAAAYAIKAARAAAAEDESDTAGRLECRCQRDQLPEAIRELVLDDQQLRNDILLVGV